MKKIVFSKIAFLAISINGFAQIPDLRQSLVGNEGKNLYKIIDSIDNVLANDTALAFSSGNGVKDYLRWSSFLKDRLGSNGINKETDYNKSIEAYQRWAAAPLCTSTLPNNSNWAAIGPFKNGSVSSHDLGQPYALWADPNDPFRNYALAGFEGGGLFLTNNLSAPVPIWTNVTDKSNFAQIGVDDIAVNPIDRKEVYISCTGSHFIQFGYGILHCADVTVANPVWEKLPLNIDPINNITNLGVVSILIDPNYNTTGLLYAVTPVKVLKIQKTVTGYIVQDLFFPNPDFGIKDIDFYPSSTDKLLISGNGLYEYDPSVVPNWILLRDNIGTDKCFFAQVESTADRIYLAYDYDGNFYGAGDEKVDYIDLTISPTAWINIYDSFTTTATLWSRNFEVHGVGFDGGTEPYPVIYMEAYADRRVRKSINHFASIIPIVTIGVFVHVDVRDISIIQGTAHGLEDRILIGCDGGIAYVDGDNPSSLDTYVNVRNANGIGLNTNLFNGFDVTINSNPEIIAGCWDNGTKVFDGTDWSVQQVNGDGGNVIIPKKCQFDGYLFDTQNPTLYKVTDIAVSPLSYNALLPASPSGGIFDTYRKWEDNRFTGNIYIGYHNLVKIDPTIGCSTSVTPYTELEIKDNLGNPIVPSCNIIRSTRFSNYDANVGYVAFNGQTWGIDPNADQDGINGPYVCDYAETQSFPAPYNGFVGQRLFRTEDGGLSWEDVSEELNQLIYFGITDIEVDNYNHNIFYVTLSDFSLTTPATERVMKGVYNAGLVTWTDMSTNLPELPINCIINYNGLYVGTDAGVYYTNEKIYPTQGWVCYNNNLPLGVITDLKVNECDGEIYASLFGRGIYKSKIQSDQLNQAQSVVVGNLTINNSRTISEKIIVPSGSTLTIAGTSSSPITIEFMPSGNIKVLPGGKLVVDYATLASNSCHQWWQGIEAVGDPSNHIQSSFTQPYIQLTNAKIEGAYVGIRGGEIEPSLVSTFNGGAILRINKSTIRDCWWGIQFNPYERRNTLGVEIRNSSVISECTFETTKKLTTVPNPLYPDAHLFPYAGISMYDVAGVDVRGNTFRNTCTDPTLQDIFYKGRGLVVFESQALISDQPILTGGSVPQTFNDLYAGIEAMGGTGLSQQSILNNQFNRNGYGIVSVGSVNYQKISGNYFGTVYGTNTNHPSPFFGGSYDNPLDYKNYVCSFGIYNDGGTGFAIENNQFVNLTSASLPLITLPAIAADQQKHIFMSGSTNPTSGTIYKNIFQKPITALQTEVDNSGMLFDCNEVTFFTGMPYPIHRFYRHNTGTLSDQGLNCTFAALYGDPESIQANTFSDGIFTGLTYCNTATTSLAKRQFWRQSSALPYYYNSFAFINTNIFHIQNEPSSWGDCSQNMFASPTLTYLKGCNVSPSLPFANACPSYVTSKNSAHILRIAKWRNIVQQLKDKLDGGNTSALLSFISTTSNNSQLRDHLILYAPYLSDVVLISLINKSPKPAKWVIEEVLTACSPLNDNVLNALVQSATNFPPYVYRDLFVTAGVCGDNTFINLINKSGQPHWVVFDVATVNNPLSNSELIALINRSPQLSNPTIRDILIQNTPLDPEVYTALINVSPSFAPWVITAINNSTYIAADPSSRVPKRKPLEELQGNINYATNEKNVAMNYLISNWADSLYYDSIANLLEDDGSVESLCALVILKCKKDTCSANTKIEQLRTIALAESDLQKRQNLLGFCEFHQRVQRLRLRPHGYFDLQPAEKIWLKSIAESNFIVAPNAKAILDFVYQTTRYRGTTIIDDEEKKQLIDESATNEMTANGNNISFDLNPNPANYFVEVSYYYSDDEDAKIQLRDITGKVIIQQNAIRNNGKTIVDISSLSNGIYNVSFVVPGISYLTRKLVVNR